MYTCATRPQVSKYVRLDSKWPNGELGNCHSSPGSSGFPTLATENLLVQRCCFAGKMKLSPHVRLITKHDQNWSAPQNNMDFEPIYTTYREAGTLRCPAQTYSARSLAPSIRLSLSVSLLICNLCGPCCPQSRKSLSVGEATAWTQFSSREHSQAGTRLHGLAHY